MQIFSLQVEVEFVILVGSFIVGSKLWKEMLYVCNFSARSTEIYKVVIKITAEYYKVFLKDGINFIM